MSVVEYVSSGMVTLMMWCLSSNAAYSNDATTAPSDFTRPGHIHSESKTTVPVYIVS